MNIAWSKPDFGQAEKRAAISIIKSGWLTQGLETEKFEKELVEYTGAKYAVVLNSGTSALIASLLAHNIGPGDEVIAPSFTFIATINSILAVGAKPVLVDCDIETWNLDPVEAAKFVTKRTKAIMPVDVCGMPIDIAGFRKICREHNIVLIEDAAQAIGAQYKKKRIGGFGHTTILSFHMAKLVTMVEGGAVLTNDKNIAKRVQEIRNHGRSELYKFKKHGLEYHFDSFGLNMRTNDLFSAIGRVQLSKIEQALQDRQKFVDFYKEKLSELFDFQQIPNYVSKHGNMIFAILTKRNLRDLINKKLYDEGISTRITWLPAHLQKWHRTYFGRIKLPNTESISTKIISLPLGNKISLKDAKYVVNVLKKHI